MDDKVKRLGKVFGNLAETKVEQGLGALQSFWIGDTQVNLLVEKVLSAHATSTPEEFAARLKKIGPVGRSGISVSLDVQLEDCQDPNRLAKLQAVKAALVAYRE